MMKTVLIFAMGATIGAVVSWRMAKNKYEAIAEEDIKSVKEAFKNMVEDVSKDIFTENGNLTDKDKEFKKRYNAIINNNRYSNNDKEVKMDKKRPCVISPEKFGEDDEYDTVTLYYYADGLLADDSDNLIEDIDNVIGFDSLKTFGDYEDDAVYVRNDVTKCDYEILRDDRKYMDVVSNY